MESNKKVMTGLILVTGLVHLAVGISATLKIANLLNIMLIANGIGYLTLLYFIYYTENENKELFKKILLVYTITTILGYTILFVPEDGIAAFFNPLGAITKLVEIVIVYYLLTE